tara:strand:+ start:852 stop:1106 length:255 start_codon:yes stop_codon:yes gene_type:complete
MYFVDYRADLPIELAVIRLAGAVETEAEKQNLIAAWQQCLTHGPSAPWRRIKKQLPPPPPPAPFTAEQAAVPVRRVAELEKLLA